MNSEEMEQVGRLALRIEGDFWNAYYAHVGTMEGAILLGSIRMSGIIDNPERKDAFMVMMRGIVSDATSAVVGTTPTWGGEEPAAEHEKSGRA